MSEFSIKTIKLQAKGTLEPEANAYLVHDTNEGILIDTGYQDQESVSCLLQTTRTSVITVSGIYLTHDHPDHSGGAYALASEWGCDVHCHPAELNSLKAQWQIRNASGGNVLPNLVPDLEDGTRISLRDHTFLTVYHTPGHSHGHVGIWHEPTGVLFSGDTIISSGTVWIGPPDGHLVDYLASLDKLGALEPQTVYPGHGDPIHDPGAMIEYMKARRLARENDILHMLSSWRTPQEIAQHLYGHTIAEEVFWIAIKTVQGHLAKLVSEGRVQLRFDQDKNRLIYRRDASHSCGIDISEADC